MKKWENAVSVKRIWVARGFKNKDFEKRGTSWFSDEMTRDFKCSSFTSLLASSDAGGAWKSGMFIDYVSGLPLFWHFGFKSIFIHLKVFHLVHVLRCLIWLSFIYFFCLFILFFLVLHHYHHHSFVIIISFLFPPFCITIFFCILEDFKWW